jgi:hypothetical protein
MAEGETLAGANDMYTPLVHLIHVDNFLMNDRKASKTSEKSEKSDLSQIEDRYSPAGNLKPCNTSDKLNRVKDPLAVRFECPLCGKSFSQNFLGKIQNS